MQLLNKKNIARKMRRLKEAEGIPTPLKTSLIFIPHTQIAVPYSYSSFNATISSESESAWSHESGSCVCAVTKLVAAGGNRAAEQLGIRASEARGGRSGSQAEVSMTWERTH